jgi:hypothetical protein
VFGILRKNDVGRDSYERLLAYKILGCKEVGVEVEFRSKKD